MIVIFAAPPALTVTVDTTPPAFSGGLTVAADNSYVRANFTEGIYGDDAGSVVTKDVPANMIVAGNPVRILREIYS